MRHNDARKWLHAALDLLPVLLIPVFMIYSHRHDITDSASYEVPVETFYETNEVNTYTDLQIGNIYRFTDEMERIEGHTNYEYLFSIQYTSNLSVLSLNLTENSTNIIFYIGPSGEPTLTWQNNNTNYYKNVMSTPFDFVLKSYSADFSATENIISHFSSSDLRLFKGYVYETYTFDKDIMGAFVSNFNFTINNYFNMGNVFNLNGVYQWFNTNIFNGNAPQIIYSVWNIALYELIMDLLFLLYGLFMWFIDMCKHLMEKPFRSIK